jgi:hypothetical protein
VITLSIRIYNDLGSHVIGVENGFSIHSPSSATWTATAIETTAVFGNSLFQGFFSLYQNNVDGLNSDTVGVFAGVMSAQGIPPGFNDVSLRIKIGPIPNSFHNGTICVDSSYLPPPGAWLWSVPNMYIPTWGGPYCYTIKDYSLICCTGMRGNVNDDPMGSVNVVDVSFLVAYLFQGGQPPPCTKEADIFVTNSINVVDLNSLVQYLFLGGASPPMCP